MLTLSLLRHAKSSWDDPGLGDHERPLNKRGLRDAPRIGAFMQGQHIVPDFVLCSPAVRTRSTLALMTDEIESVRPAVEYDDALYLAEPSVLLQKIRQLTASVRHALLIGHNPGLHTLALELAGDGDRRDLARLALGFPTAALAVIDFDVARWGEVAPGRGRLRLFITPKTID